MGATSPVAGAVAASIPGGAALPTYDAFVPEPADAPPAETSDDELAPALLTLLWRTTAMLVLLTFCYYTLPERSITTGHDVLKLVGAITALAGFFLVLRVQVRAVRRKRTLLVRAEALLTGLYVLILVFALVYNAISISAPAQFAGLGNKTDSLYFTMTVVSTVGFGDIHAAQTGARALVTLQMLFDVIYLGAALKVLSTLGRRHVFISPERKNAS